MIFQVDLKNGYHSYGRVVVGKLYAFYDTCTKEDLKVQDIINQDVLFITTVHNTAIKSKRWEVLATVKLEEHLMKYPIFFMQDVTNLNRIYKYDSMIGQKIPATYEECEHLERLAVWAPEHIEERLEKHFAGKESIWLKSMSLIRS